MDRQQFPISAWSLIEQSERSADIGTAEVLFSVANGYLGMRGNHEEHAPAYVNGTYLNGFHETWPIRYAETAFGFATTGQTIVNAPNTKSIRLFVDEEPFDLATADMLEYRRELDFRDGILRREVLWRTPTGTRVRVRSSRMVSFTHRHLGAISYAVDVDRDAHLLLISETRNEQDGSDDQHGSISTANATFDPRKADRFTDRVLLPEQQHVDADTAVLTFRTASSGMRIGVGSHHTLTTPNAWDSQSNARPDTASHTFSVHARAGSTTRLDKLVAYHFTDGGDPTSVSAACERSITDIITAGGGAQLRREQRTFLDAFWERSDVEVDGQPGLQQAIRWNLFQLAQSTLRADGWGTPAKGLSGSGYGGHYFWDGEIFVLPFLTYTTSQATRNALLYRYRILDSARRRAQELNQRGALFPWRTINGEESSGYYAASTAQYHIDADVAFAVMKYVNATGDTEFLDRYGVEILIETARMWEDLGFWREHQHRRFHIEGVTGPDEYTTVVNDNLYTNTMARANLWAAVRACESLRERHPARYADLSRRLNLDESELFAWADAAEHMEIPYDPNRRIHPQDAHFLDRELWDLEATPDTMRPLLLHYHPLVIYRFQVLKQADVVLTLFLQGSEFTPDEKLRDFEYYDALTTGDSSLSAAVQSIIAAEVGHRQLAADYFRASLFVDLANTHGNTPDGLHTASLGGTWSALIFGFAGMRDYNGDISFDPRLPEDWPALRFTITVRGTAVHVAVTGDAITCTAATDTTITIRGERIHLPAGVPTTTTLHGHGPVINRTPPTARDLQGWERADGSVVTATIPTLSIPDTGIHAD